MTHRKISYWIKFLFIVFIVIFIPVYWVFYGPSNFLWFSDLILFLVFFATIFESKFLASMAAVGGFIFTLLWNIDFFLTLGSYLFGIEWAGLTDYMFNTEFPVWVRCLSLFHVLAPLLILWLIYRLGYHKWAWIFQIIFSGIVILITWLVTNPSENINGVFSYITYKWLNIEATLFLIIEFVIFSMIIVGSHFLFNFLQKKETQKK